MTTAIWFWSITAFLFGVNIGSFLNVVIYRLPRGGSLIEPKHSYCPHCERQLTAIDLVPLFSFLCLGRRCRTCRQPISWRYFSVELLTGVLFMALALRFPHSAPDAVSLMLFTALLVPMTFIDLDFYQIPHSLNLLAFGVAIGRDIWGIVQHEPNHAPLWGWLPRFIPGALAGILVFGGVRLAGWLWKRQEAMGLGDVVLARAMGALLVQLAAAGLPLLRLFPAWILFACLTGMIVGIPMILVRGRQEEQAIAEAAAKAPVKRADGRAEAEQQAAQSDIDEEPSSLREQLADIGYCIVLGDLLDYLRVFLPSGRAAHVAQSGNPEPAIAEEDFTPQPTAIPFGPFLAVGFLAAVFVGEKLTSWYLAFALPKT